MCPDIRNNRSIIVSSEAPNRFIGSFSFFELVRIVPAGRLARQLAGLDAVAALWCITYRCQASADGLCIRTLNIQRPTFNVQSESTREMRRFFSPCWMFDVDCWTFLFPMQFLSRTA